MPRYRDQLKAHPGVPMAAMMTVAGAFAGAANESMSVVGGALWGAAVMGSICWSIVLWTARTRRDSRGTTI